MLPCTRPLPRGGLTDLHSVSSTDKSLSGVIGEIITKLHVVEVLNPEKQYVSGDQTKFLLKYSSRADRLGKRRRKKEAAVVF